MPGSEPCQVAAPVLLRSAALPVDTLFGEVPDLALRLEALADQPAVREALALASPELADRVERWRSGRLEAGNLMRVRRALLRYLSRMCARATPFGLFAAVSPGGWGPASHLRLHAWGQGRKAVRLDWGLLEDLVRRLEADPDLRVGLGLHPNSSLQRWGEWYRYLARRPGDPADGPAYHLEAVETSPHLEAALAGAQGGTPMGLQAARLAERLGVTDAEARDFLEQLLQEQVLGSDLHPPVTAADPLDWVRRVLADAVPTSPLAAPLGALAAGLQALEAAPLGAHPGGYRGLAAPLAELGCDASARDVVQVDLHRPAPGLALGPAVGRALEGGADLLRRLTPEPASPSALERFRSAFLHRYGSRWVPLLQALDEESGLGFDGGLPPDAPLLEGLPLGGTWGEAALTSRERFLLGRLVPGRGTGPWVLDAQDLERLTLPEPPPFPASFAALVSLSAPDEQALNRGDFQFWMEAYTGPTAARYLGRFAGGDAALERGLRALLAEEEARRPGVLFAEVVHQPDGRSGNVVARPALRRHEIPCLGTAGVPAARQVRLGDLEVTVQGDRVRLASRPLGREVVPRLSTAHNFARGPAVYRFLAQLQDQDGAPGGWSWGALGLLPFLPRVQVGRHVLSRARWRIQGRELEAARARAGRDPGAVIACLREDRQLPRHVVLTEADNALLVDLDQPLMVEGLHHLVARREDFVLTECFPEPHLHPVQGPEGRFAHELVIPFIGTAGGAPPPPLPAFTAEVLPRAYPPGSAWLYLKLYCGAATADRVLADLAPLLQATHAEGLWDRWHFVRYRDPDLHLRLRFHGRAATLMGRLLPRVRDHLAAPLEQGLLQRWQVDTFEPEYARYGGELGFALAEAWFHEDSQAILDALVAGLDAESRWRGGFSAVDAIWASLGLTVPERLALAQDALASFRREFRDTGPAAVAMGRRFRQLRASLSPLLEDLPPGSHLPGCRALTSLREALSRGTLSVERDSLAGSLGHMHLNRRFRDHAREQEWVLMAFLARSYEAQLARGGQRR